MRLVELAIQRWPGIHEPFRLSEDELGAGLHLIHGPNASGKTTLCRALRAVLWRATEAGVEPLSVAARFEHDGAIWRAEREGARVQWGRDGAACEAPPLPEAHLAHCFAITDDELLERGADGGWFAQAVRRAMAGGYDLGEARSVFALGAKHGESTQRQLRDARADLADRERKEQEVLRREARLPDLRAELEAARVARLEVGRLEGAAHLVRERSALLEAEQRLQALPAVLARVSGQEGQQLEKLRQALAAEAEEERQLRGREEAARASAAEAGLAAAIAPGELQAQAQRLQALRDAERDLQDARRRREEVVAALEAVPATETAALAERVAEPWLWILVSIALAAVVLLGLQLHLAWLLFLVPLGLAAAGLARGRGAALRDRIGRLSERERELDQRRTQRSEDLARRGAEVLAREEARDQLAAQLREFLSEHGQAPRSLDPADLAAAFSELESRSAAVRAAETELKRAGSDRRPAEERRQRLERELAGLFAGLGLEASDEQGLRQRVRQAEEWRRATKLVDERRGAVRKLEEPLAGSLELCDLGLEEIAARLEATRERESRHDALVGEIKGIEASVQQARARSDREDAVAQVDELERRLAREREEALEAETARVLLDQVEEEHTSLSRPAVLQRARSLFSAFTHGAWELDVDPREQGAPYARETRRPDLRLGPAQLSSGTRAQLLLAVKLAYLEDAERGVRLPLVLDDALRSSDPERTVAIASSLFALCRDEGRQVLVLGDDPADAGLLRAGARDDAEAERLRVIDLAAVRRRQSSVRGRERLAPPAVDPVPSPRGMSPAEYAERIGVAGIDPRAGVDDLHLYWLLTDDLELLKRILDWGASRLGQLRAMARDGGLPALGEAELERIEAWASLAGTALASWRVGRGLPLSREVLERCPGISERFLPGALELAEKNGWNARAFAQALRAKALSGFYASKMDETEQWLLSEGHLSPDEPLPRERAWQEVVRTAAQLDPHLRPSPESLRSRFELLWERCHDVR